MPRVTIIGTGLIGASIGLGMKKHGPRDLEVVGHERSLDHAKQALRTHAVDRMERDLAAAVEGAALVIIATPILAMREVLEVIAPALEAGAVVTDTGSTKADIVNWGRTLLPDTTAFVGGHPMAGKTDSGPLAADAALFQDARWIVVPDPLVPPDAVDVVVGLAQMLGAKPGFMDAHEHDAYAAAISHLPLVAATGLFRLARSSEAWPELSALASSGFRDTTRLTATEPVMAHDIAITNRAQIVHWIERYREELRLLQLEIADTDHEAELFRTISESNMQYAAYRAGAVGRREVDDDQFDTIGDISMMDQLMGGQLAERARELTRRSEERIAESERTARAAGRDG